MVIIVLDDVGFAQLGCFGSDLATPAIDRLAAEGLRYRNFHVTALCSPTRAAALTGRNHHAVGMGFLPEIPTAFPGYNARIPRSAATLPRLLRDTGYSTFAVGKWHLVPRWEVSASGPFERWPLGLGFERYYGFLHGDANQWAPELVRDNGFVDPPAGPDDGYHLTADLVDQALRMVQDQHQATPDKPFLLWFATGAMHAPHQAPAEYIDRFAGRFDDGWEAWREASFARQVAAGVVPEGTTLTGRPPWIPPWEELSADGRRLAARMMEVFAGFLAHTDDQIGRLLSGLEALDVLDDTLLLLFSDNGASAEGGPDGSFNEHRFTHDRVDDVADTLARINELGGHRAYNHYPWGWAWAANTPFKLWKRYTWLGGVRTPLIVRWPSRVPAAAAGAVRPQFCHAVDVMPSVLDAVGIDAPDAVDGVAQQPLAGASLLPTVDDADAPDPRREQYFEMLGSRAMYLDGWKATTDHVGRQISVERERVPGSHEFADDRWSLYRLTDDFAEAHDLAEAEPAKLAQLVERWWLEAGRNQVLPLDDSMILRAVAMDPNPWPAARSAVYRPGGGPVAEDLLPAMGAGFTLTAAVEVDAASGSGTICALGDWNNGWAWYVLDGRLTAAFALFSGQVVLRAAEPLAPGRHRLALRYDRSDGIGGEVTLWSDGADAPVAAAQLDEDLPFRWQIGGAGLLVGRDHGFPVHDEYRPPFPFPGTIDAVELTSHGPGDPPGPELVARFLHHE